MKEEDIFNLKINQVVKVKCEDGIEGFFIGKVKTIDDWRKLVGIVNSKDTYQEYPYRLINYL